MKKWIKITLWSLLSIVIIVVVFGFAFYKRFVINPPEYTFDSPKNIMESQLQDLEYLALYPDYDRSFDTDAKRVSFENQLKIIEQKIPVSKAEFEMEIAKAMALADNTHTNISASARARRMNSIPLRFYWFREGLYVILAQEGFLDLLGKRVTKINGISPDDMLQKMKPWFGGTFENIKAQSTLFFISPEILNAVSLGNDKNAIEMEFTNSEGLTQVKNIPASELEKKTTGYWPDYWLNPYTKINNSKWKSCKAEINTALPFQYIDKNVHHHFVNKILYVQINENYNTEERFIKEYLKQVSLETQDRVLDGIVLDLRFNPGGDNYHLPWPFIRFINDYLEDDQKCWIITSNNTFSAGIITAAYAKYTLGDKALIIGEKVGDRMQFWADGGSKMTLPNSKISPRIWTAYNDWGNGCKDFNKCFWIALFDSVPAGNLNPDKEIVLSFDDYVNGKDSVLEYILYE